jgi:hypothetical protein
MLIDEERFDWVGRGSQRKTKAESAPAEGEITEEGKTRIAYSLIRMGSATNSTEKTCRILEKPF